MHTAEAHNVSKLAYLSKEDESRYYFESAKTGIIILDEHLRIKNLNREAERLCGLDRPNILGKKADMVFKHFGDKFLKLFSITEYDDFLSLNLRVKLKEQLAYLHADALKLRSASGEPDGMVLIIQDVTSVRAAIKQIQTTQLLASLGELAAGVAHHVRTPLTTISGYLQIMLGRLENDHYSVRRDVLEMLLDEVSYINRVVKDLVMFAKPPVNKESAVDINRVLEDALLLTFKELGGENIVIDKMLIQDMPALCVDSHLIKQALVNILQNAVEAMPERGVLTVKTWLNADLNMVVIAITDTGEGVAPEILSRVFEPFYTTKLDRMGLGLPIAHRIVTEHGGFININPGSEGGTKVHVYLPIADSRIRRLSVMHQQILNLQ